MKPRLSVALLFAVVVVSAGMGQNGCQGVNLVNTLRPRPAIIVENVSTDTLTRTMSVDLRAYPDAMRISWEFGDGGTRVNQSREQGRTVTHTYPGGGTYVIRVHLFSAVDPFSRVSARITTGELPIAVVGPNASPTARLAIREVLDSAGEPRPRLLEFDGSASADADGQIVNHAWDFGDGTTTEGGAVIQHTYQTSGQFIVSLTVTDNRGATATVSQAATVNLRPTASFDMTDLTGQPGVADRTILFSAAGSTDVDGTLVSFTWDFGDGSPAGAGDPIEHTYATPGEFDVTLTVTDDLGGQDVATRTADVTGSAPFVESIDRQFGETDTELEVTISGFNFERGSTARIVGQQAPDIVSTNVDFLSDRALRVTFNLAGAPTGSRDLLVTGPGGQTSTLPGALSVVTATRVRIVTNLGDIVLELDPVAAPNTVANFFQYVEDDFYDNIVFHRVPGNFVIQAGAFLSLGEGADPRLNEIQPRPAIDSEALNGRSNLRGTLSLALRGSDADSGTSQFFINVVDNLFLDDGSPPFTVFGEVVEGMEVVDAIDSVTTGTFNVQTLDGGITSFSDVPVQDVLIIDVRRE